LCTTVSGNGAVRNGMVYQHLARLTGGLRFPICQLSSFDSVFAKIAEGIVEGAQVECSFVAPQPEGAMLDLSRVVLYYTPEGGEVQSFTRVDGPGSCGPNAFYVEADVITLCPEACDAVQGDPGARIALHVACEIIVP
jgi:hypothetical protein